jgi:hypothetical protein
VTVTHAADDGIRLTVRTTADPTLYDTALTLITPVPAGWKTARVSQGENSQTIAVLNASIQHDAQPNGPEIVLKRV